MTRVVASTKKRPRAGAGIRHQSQYGLDTSVPSPYTRELLTTTPLLTSKDAADEEEERDSPSVFRAPRRAGTPGPIAVPRTAQLLIPLRSAAGVSRFRPLPRWHSLRSPVQICSRCIRSPRQPPTSVLQLGYGTYTAKYISFVLDYSF